MRAFGLIVELVGAVHAVEYLRLHTVLKIAVGREESLNGTVNVAGGSALWSYMVNSFPRNKQFTWRPSDADIYVCGSYGSTEDAFNDYVDAAIERLSEQGFIGIESVQYSNHYVFSDQIIWIRDIDVAGVNATLSFIQCPGKTNVAAAIEGFDIDVVKVILRIHDEEEPFEPVDETIAYNIRTMQAEVYAFSFKKPGHPNEYELLKINKTLKRVRKYSRRGFKFVNLNGVQFV